MPPEVLNTRTRLDHRYRAHHMRRMVMWASFFWSNHFWATMSALSAVVVLVSSLADRRRHRRPDINNVGFMPWTAITVFSVLATVLSIALAVKVD